MQIVEMKPKTRKSKSELSDYGITRATLHRQGTDSEYHLFGGFLEGGDMLHGSAHVDVKVGLLPPMALGISAE